MGSEQHDPRPTRTRSDGTRESPPSPTVTFSRNNLLTDSLSCCSTLDSGDLQSSDSTIQTREDPESDFLPTPNQNKTLLNRSCTKRLPPGLPRLLAGDAWNPMQSYRPRPLPTERGWYLHLVAPPCHSQHLKNGNSHPPQALTFQSPSTRESGISGL